LLGGWGSTLMRFLIPFIVVIALTSVPAAVAGTEDLPPPEDLPLPNGAHYAIDYAKGLAVFLVGGDQIMEISYVLNYGCSWEGYGYNPDGTPNGHYNCQGTFVTADEGFCRVKWTDDDAGPSYDDDGAKVTWKNCYGLPVREQLLDTTIES